MIYIHNTHFIIMKPTGIKQIHPKFEKSNQNRERMNRKDKSDRINDFP